jgi:leucine dehydrogenase
LTQTLAAEPEPKQVDGLDHEEVVVRRGRRSGAEMIVAIHSTVLGPALGGARMWGYESPLYGLRDALRLAKAMTWKGAAAGLDLGGGKGVICREPGPPPADSRRRDLLHDFGDLVESLDGRYVTAEDVGTGTEDVAVIAERTSHVAGLPPEMGGSGDPSPFTALGVEAAMRACARHRLGSADLAGRRIALIGLGHVGTRLARRLASAGADLTVTDIDPAKRRLAAELGAGWLDPGEAAIADCDVLAPCALGGAINRANAGALRCAVVCGSANNVLSEEALAAELATRDILYAPDFIANAGGLISVYREVRGYATERVRELVLGIEDSMERILDRAERSSITPLEAARELALERLHAARSEPLHAAAG